MDSDLQRMSLNVQNLNFHYLLYREYWFNDLPTQTKAFQKFSNLNFAHITFKDDLLTFKISMTIQRPVMLPSSIIIPFDPQPNIILALDFSEVPQSATVVLI